MTDTATLAALLLEFETLDAYGEPTILFAGSSDDLARLIAAGVTLDPRPADTTIYSTSEAGLPLVDRDSSRDDLIHRIELLTADLAAEQARPTPPDALREALGHARLELMQDVDPDAIIVGIDAALAAVQCHHTNLANDGRFCLDCRAALAQPAVVCSRCGKQEQHPDHDHPSMGHGFAP
jgi:hypothetical protein